MMDLTEVPGIGEAYAERLAKAGVHDAESLADARDVAALAEASGVPRTRLEASAIQARLRLEARPDESGVAMEVHETELERWLAEVAGHALTLKEWATDRLRHVELPRLGRTGRTG